MSDVRRRLVGWTVLLGSVALAAAVGAPLVGTTRINLARAFDTTLPYADNVDAQIFFIARLPRVLAAALVGASLAAAGVVFQALLRNPLGVTIAKGLVVSLWRALNAAETVVGGPTFFRGKYQGVVGG